MSCGREEGRVAEGSVKLDQTELLGLRVRALNEIRGHEIAMVFQDPQNSLNPAFTVGKQLVETIRNRRRISKDDAHAEAVARRTGSVRPIERKHPRFDRR